MLAITRWAVLGLIAVASAGANAFADKSPLEGMSFDVAITHGGKPVGASRLQFEHGYLVETTRWHDRARYRWYQKGDTIYFSATLVRGPGNPSRVSTAERHGYYGQVSGSSISATFEARQKGLVVTYRMTGAVSEH